MTDLQKFQLCMRRARRIVRNHRKMVPAGFDPKCTWVALAVGVTTAVAGGIEAHQQAKAQQKAAESQAAQLQTSLASDAYGHVPDAAHYKPVDFNADQISAIRANRDAIPDVRNLVTDTNNFVSNDALRRAYRLIPGYSTAMNSYGSSANALLKGQLPFDDVLGIASDRAGLAGSLGTPGAAGPATLKDLGMSRLDAIKTGGGMLGDMVRIAETISPRSTYLNPATQFINPMDRINLDMTQNELIQQSEQNANNLAATGQPLAQAQLGANVALAGIPDNSKAQQTHTATQVFSLLGNTLASKYGNGAAGGGGGTYTPQYNYVQGMGYVARPRTLSY